MDQRDTLDKPLLGDHGASGDDSSDYESSVQEAGKRPASTETRAAQCSMAGGSVHVLLPLAAGAAVAGARSRENPFLWALAVLLSLLVGVSIVSELVRALGVWPIHLKDGSGDRSREMVSVTRSKDDRDEWEPPVLHTFHRIGRANTKTPVVLPLVFPLFGPLVFPLMLL